MTVKDYSVLKGMTVQAVHYQIKTGKLKAKKIGSLWLVNVSK